MRKKQLFIYIKYGLLLLFVVGFILYFQKNSENFSSLKSITAIQFSVLFALNFLFYAINGFIISCFLNCFQLRLKFLELFYLSVLTTFGNYFLPLRGGAALRGVYLKQRYQLKYSRFMVAMMAQLLLVLLVALLAMFVFSVKLFFESNFEQYQLMLGLAALSALSLLPIFFSALIYKLIPLRYLKKIVFPLYRGWALVCKNPRNLARLFFFSCLNLVTISILLYFELIFLGVKSTNGTVPSIFDTLFISVFNSLSSILIITPGAIGIRESMMMAVSSFVSFKPEDILVASVLDRSVNIIFIIVAVGVTSLLMRRIWKK